MPEHNHLPDQASILMKLFEPQTKNNPLAENPLNQLLAADEFVTTDSIVKNTLSRKPGVIAEYDLDSYLQTALECCEIIIKENPSREIEHVKAKLQESKYWLSQVK